MSKKVHLAPDDGSPAASADIIAEFEGRNLAVTDELAAEKRAQQLRLDERLKKKKKKQLPSSLHSAKVTPNAAGTTGTSPPSSGEAETGLLLSGHDVAVQALRAAMDVEQRARRAKLEERLAARRQQRVGQLAAAGVTRSAAGGGLDGGGGRAGG